MPEEGKYKYIVYIYIYIYNVYQTCLSYMHTQGSFKYGICRLRWWPTVGMPCTCHTIAKTLVFSECGKTECIPKYLLFKIVCGCVWALRVGHGCQITDLNRWSCESERKREIPSKWERAKGKASQERSGTVLSRHTQSLLPRSSTARVHRVPCLLLWKGAASN